MQQLTLPAKGMRCSGCERAVETSVGELDGVREVNATRREQQVTVLIDESRTDEEAIRVRIKQAGYGVKLTG